MADTNVLETSSVWQAARTPSRRSLLLVAFAVVAGLSLLVVATVVLFSSECSCDQRLDSAENDIGVHATRLDSAENDIEAHRKRLDTAEADVGALQAKHVERDNRLADRLADLEAMFSAVIVEVEPPSSATKLRDLSGNYLIFNSDASKYEFSGAQESDGVSIDFIPGSEGGYLLGDSTTGNFIRSDGDALYDAADVPDDEFKFRVCYTTKVSGESRLALRHLKNAVNFMGRSATSATFQLSAESERAVRI